MPDKRDDESLIQEALEQFSESDQASSEVRQNAAEDIRFSRLADQWPDDIVNQRKQENRPCLTINRLPSFIRQVVNDARQSKPGIVVSPVDNGADPDTAKVIGGIIRSIERMSAADIAYDTAIDNAVSGGFGFFQLAIEYAHADTFDMECRIKRIADPLAVHWDVSSTEFDASDWDYAFVSDLLTEEQFKARFPKARPVSFSGDSPGELQDWIVEGRVRIADYWRREEVKRQLLLLSDKDGKTMAVREDLLPNIAKMALEQGGIDLGGMLKDDELGASYMQMNGLAEVRRREVTAHEVCKYVMSGAEILSEDKWPGSTIPICPVWGEEVYSGGRRWFRSMIRDARDPQLMFNYWRTAATELVALAPKAPFLVHEDGIPDGVEGEKWKFANTRSFPYLMFSGSMMPQRQQPPSQPVGAIQEALNAADDMKAIIGIYDSSLGARSNETSGRAIAARQRESDVSNFHFIDNLNRAIEYAGRCLVEVIPSVYSQREVVRIIGEDDAEEVVKLMGQGRTEATDADGARLYDLTVGKYDVNISSGPSYATAREETRETLVEIMSRVPGSAPLIGDVLLEHMDFVGADKVAERLRVMLPPQIQAAEGIVPPAMPQPIAGTPAMPAPFGATPQQMNGAMPDVRRINRP